MVDVIPTPPVVRAGAPDGVGGRGFAAADRAFHGRRPAGIGPRAGQEQPRCSGDGWWRRAPLPGAGRNVASRSRVTKKSRPARRAAGSSAPDSGRNRSRSSATGVDDSRRRPTPTRRGTDRPGQAGLPGAVEHPLDRRADAGHERLAQHLPVEDDVHVDDRRAAEFRRPAGLGGRTRRPARALSAAGGGTARITSSAVSSPSPTVEPDQPDRARSMPVDLRVRPHVDAGRRSARARRRRRAASQWHQRPADVGRAGVGRAARPGTPSPPWPATRRRLGR